MSPRRALVALALAVGLAHLPFIATSLEDIDSVNFALGLRDFDVADHRPHPPGYPVYIALGKAVVTATTPLAGGDGQSVIEARALSILSLLAAIASTFVLYRVFAAPRAVRAEGRPWDTLDVPALAATALTLTCPMVWALAIRPMSDLPGLAMALAAQACFLTAWWWQTTPDDGDSRMSPETLAASGRMIVLGALVAGVAVGLRTQTFWYTVPLLGVVLVDRIGRGVAGAIIGAAMTFAIGALAWAVPLLVASGGPGPYLAALGTQAGEDFASGEMLYTNPAPRLVVMALVHTFVDPWDSVPLASVVLALAAGGALGLVVRERRTLAVVSGMSLPYLVFHLLFQDTAFTRYATPLVPVVSYLAVRGVGFVSARAVAPVAAVLTSWAVALAAPTLVEYAAQPAPAVRVVAAMNAEAAAAPPAALAMHQTFQRPLQAERVDVTPVLPSPPRREWLELAAFWRNGQGGPVWFLADPRRTDLALFDPQSRRDVQRIRWAPASRRIFGDMRPAAVDWVRMSPPRWFAEEGWALTPETAGMARLMGRGPHLGPIVARVRRDPRAQRVLVGGRNLAGAGDPPARFTMAVDGRPVEEWDAAPGFFLRTVDLPEGTLGGDGPFAALTLQSAAAPGGASIPTAVEQFDLQPHGTLMWGLGEGWHEAEYTPRLGIWHWTSERATLRVVGATTAVRVDFEIESPLTYFDASSQVKAIAGGRELATSTIGADTHWSFDVPLEALESSGGAITIETAQTFVPAERGGGSDRRRLGLRVFDISVNPVGLR
ncbi:MAG: DUF2723 domain-containing protein [Vicinamibacterales bacterium]